MRCGVKGGPLAADRTSKTIDDWHVRLFKLSGYLVA